MSYAARLEAQNDRIRRYLVAETKSFTDPKAFITEDRLWDIWREPFAELDSRTLLDEFQACVPSPELSRKLYSAIKSISILICMDWHHWDQFPRRFCQLTERSTLDDVQMVDAGLPYKRELLERRLFPDNLDHANNFFRLQYIFLPLVLEENQGFRSYEAEYRLPLLEDPTGEREGHCERIIPVKVAIGHFRFARGGDFNSIPQSLRRKRLIEPPDFERELQNLAILKNAEETSDRIMRHLLALRIGPEYSVFFDEAQLDLEMLLSGEYHPYYADSAMAAQPLVGEGWYLAGALDFLHRRFVDRRTRILCCHIDLKPANILIVKDVTSRVGKWMLTDFGISVIKTEPRRGCLAAAMYGDEGHPKISVAKSVKKISAYQPPEVEQDLSVSHHGSDRQMGDIWSFGCILLTLLVFSLGGGPLVNTLHSIRKQGNQPDFFFWTLEIGLRPVHKVKDHIKPWVTQLGSSCGQAAWVNLWADIIFDRMLLISPTQRLEADHIQTLLDVVWRHAPEQNVWSGLLQALEVRPRSPSRSESPNAVASVISSPPLRHQALVRSSASEPGPMFGGTLKQGKCFENLTISQSPLHVSSAPPSARTNGSTETSSSDLARGHLVDEMDLSDDLSGADEIAVCSESERIAFWHSRAVILYTRNSSNIQPGQPLLSHETNEAMTPSIRADKGSAKLIAVSLSCSYVALAFSTGSYVHVKAVNLLFGREVQPSTNWPSDPRLRSVCISSRGCLAFCYDKEVKFRCIGESSHLRNSNWSTGQENICAASFSKDGKSFFALSWNHLWIGKVEDGRWRLKNGGKHHLSTRPYLPFKPYIVPFKNREAVLAHNPDENRLRYLQANSSTSVDLGEGLMRVALSEGEEILISIRKLQRSKKILSRAFYGLSWRFINWTPAGVINLGRENDIIDLNIAVEENKMFSISTSIEQDVIVAWVETPRGEIRKCRLE